METKSDDGVYSINATSKPRGTYLDPFKACALSGESGVSVGKSESATYSRYMGLVRQTRRTASRASVLNDVERSRLAGALRRLDDERAYSHAALERQRRQFRRSLDSLAGRVRPADQGALTGGAGAAAPPPAHLRAKRELLAKGRRRRWHDLGSVDERGEAGTDASLPPVESVEEPAAHEAAGPTASKTAGRRRRGQDRGKTSEAHADRHQEPPVFFTGLGPHRLRGQLSTAPSREDVQNSETPAI